MNRLFFQDSLSDRQYQPSARTLSLLIVVSWVAYLIVFLSGRYYEDRKLLLVMIVTTIVQIISFWFIRCRRLSASSWTLMVNMLGTLTVLATFGQGCNDSSILAFPIILVFASVALSRAAFVSCVGLMLAAVGWLAFGEIFGWYTPLPFATATWVDFVALSVILLVSALAIDLLARNMRKGLEQAQKEIAQRKQAEEKLIERESRLTALFDSAGYSISVAKNGVQVLGNPAFANLFGYRDASEIAGSSFIETIAPEERERLAKYAAERVKGTATPTHYETKGIRRDGSIFDMEVMISTYVSNNELYTVGFQSDISERKRMDIKLRETMVEAQRFREAIDHVSAYIYMKDLQSRYVFANEPTLHLFGCSAEELVGCDDSRFFPPDTVRRLREVDARVFAGEKTTEEIDVIDERGHRVYLEIKTPLYADSEHKKMWGLLGISTDVTERKKMEESLQTSQKLESLGVLAGGIAHDFNNLMGGIFGYIDLASGESKNVKVTHYLSKAMNTIERGRGLTQQLLTFAKGGAPVLKIGALFPFVQETAEFALSGASVSCRFHVPRDLWACNFDKNQIAQVVDNIVINAQQAMPVGGTIVLSARNVALGAREHGILVEGNYVKISIEDQGVGIPKELVTRIFDPFFTTKTKGHGLGLATCNSIINRHGGCIEVESEAGKGSTFHVYLPAADGSIAATTDLSLAEHKGYGTFLIMDDQEVMRDMIGEMLESFGYIVIGKESGRDAVDFFASEIREDRNVAGMIFDLTIPGGMGGREAIGEIRKLCLTTPVFVASGYAEDPVMANPQNYGFTASICKPFRKIELAEMLNTYMKKAP